LAFVLVRRGHFVPDGQLRRRCVGMVGASVAMGLTLCGVRIVLFQVPPHGGLRMISLAGLVGAGMLAYAIAAPLLGAYDLREIRRMVLSRRLRGANESAITSAPTTET
jgi:putative peptidoglycan lipid II flippase